MIYVSPLRAAVSYCCDELHRFDVRSLECTAGMSPRGTWIYTRHLIKLQVLRLEGDLLEPGPFYRQWTETVPRARPKHALPNARVYDKSRRLLVAQLIRTRREAVGKTQSWLAQQAYVSKNTISKLERARNTVTAETMKRIIRALEIEDAKTYHAPADVPGRADQGPDQRHRGDGAGLSGDREDRRP